jgi:hypothetical protein
MFPFRFVAWVSLALTVASCGYPLDRDSWFPDIGVGAIAFSPEEFTAALTARDVSQQEANSGAMKLCGTGCEIVLRFEDDNLCGALARGNNHRFGVGSGKPQSATDSAALDDCIAQGGMECTVKLNGCNS